MAKNSTAPAGPISISAKLLSVAGQERTFTFHSEGHVATASRHLDTRRSRLGATVERLEVRSLFSVTVDPTFGVNGVVQGYVNPLPGGVINAVAVGRDGRIVAAGGIGPGIDQSLLPQSSQAAVIRYGPNGKIDTTFGDQGKIVQSFGGAVSAVRGIALQPDGKIVAVGYTGPDPAHVQALVARFDASGRLDKTFATTGYVVIAPGTEDDAKAVALDPDGRILVTGTNSDGTSTHILLTRLLPSGKPDDTFGDHGTVVDTRYDHAAANAVAIQPNGRIVIAGSVSSQFAIARFTSSGSPDSSFNANGVYASGSPPSDLSGAVALALTPGGNILAAGNIPGISPGRSAQILVLRLNGNGRPDPLFGSGGTFRGQLPYFDAPGPSTVAGIALTPSGKIVVAGTAGVNPETLPSLTPLGDVDQMAALRLTARGKIDKSFGTGGAVNKVFDLQSIDLAKADAVAVQSDGKIILAGATQDAEFGGTAGSSGFDLLRFTPEGKPDPAFGDAGYVGPEPRLARLDAANGAVMPDGKIVVSDYPPFLLTRLTPDGAPDPSFGNSAHVSTTFHIGDDFNDEILQVIPLPDGRVLAAGFAMASDNINSTPTVIVRYNADGSLDPSFARHGILILPLPRADQYEFQAFLRLLPLAGGKFTVAEQVGSADLAGNPAALYLRRFNPDGSLDRTFGRHGLAKSYLPFNASQALFQDDGKLLLLGGETFTSSAATVVARYTRTGALDKTFGTGGVLGLEPGFFVDRMAVDASRRIILTGRTDSSSGGSLPVSRYLPDGSLDTSFGTDGFATLTAPITVPFGAAEVVALPDSSVVALLSGMQGSAQYTLLAGLTPDGLPNPAFGPAGSALLATPPFFQPTSLFPTASDTFIITGYGGVLKIIVT